MSLNSFLAKLGETINAKLATINTGNATTQPVGNFSIDASIFAGADIDTFMGKIESGLNIEGSDSIFYQSIKSAGAEDVFEYLDEDGNGIIDDNEIKGMSSVDGDEEDISSYDLSYMLNSLAYSKIHDNFDALVEAGKIDVQESNRAAMESYSANIGGSNYKNYGSQTANGSTISSQEEYSTKERLENIENKEIPELEEKRQEVIDTAQSEIDAKNEELDKVIEDNKEKLGQLGEDYSDKQNEIQECDKNISEYSTQISEAESQKHTCESEKAGLESELASLDTNTDDEEVNAANQERKNEIEARISELEKEIEELDKTIEETKAAKAEEEELKAQKEEELAQIQEEIEKQNPEIAKQMQEIKEAITQIETQRDEDVAEIDEQIRAKREEAIECQKEIGERTGKAESITGSKVVQDALALAMGELEKGVYELTGNNDGAEIAKYRNGVANNQPWCASFVSWLYGAGQNSDNAGTFGYDASVSGIMNDAKAAGYYSEKGSYTPQAGDIMIQKNNGSSHTGIIVSVDADGTIHTIEGNSSDRVQERTYKPGSSGYSDISGYVRMGEWLSE